MGDKAEVGLRLIRTGGEYRLCQLLMVVRRCCPFEVGVVQIAWHARNLPASSTTSPQSSATRQTEHESISTTATACLYQHLL